MRIHDLLHDITTKLQLELGSYAASYAERILQHFCGCNRSELYCDRSRTLDASRVAACREVVARCRRGEPLEYVLGVAYFYNREFIVSNEVLIPRPDTEVLVETVLARESADTALIADMGTGSGILACILTEQRSGWYAAAVDCSQGALDLTRSNSRTARVMPVCGDRLTMVRSTGVFDLIVSNPPYISSTTIKTLARSVREFEPYGALDGGLDGLDFYRYLATAAPALLKKGRSLYCEIGYDQGEHIRQLFTAEFWNAPEILPDLSGNDRVLCVTTLRGHHEKA